MARLKKTSSVLEKATTRMDSLKAIDSLDLGSELTVAAYQAAIDLAQSKLSKYTTLLSEADAALNDFKAEEKKLATLSARMLAAVGVKYGKDSNEYEMAGGTRTSEIKRTNTPPAPPATP